MSDLFSNDNYKSFAMTLMRECMTIKVRIENAKEAIAYIAEEANIGRVHLTFSGPSTAMTPRGEKYNNDIFDSKDVFTESSRLFHFDTVEKGYTEFTFYSRKGHIYTAEDERILSELALVLFRSFSTTRKSELLSQSMVTDVMTHIPNREGFFKFGAGLFRKGIANKYSAFFFNIKNFKYVNKMISYHEGDRILIKYAQKLLDFCDSEEIVGRLGGDNFVALIKNEHVDAFVSFISNVPIEYESLNETKVFNISVASGAYRINNEVNNISDVMMCISVALPFARSIRKTDIEYYHPDMLKNTINEKTTLVRFGQALENREIIPYFQPKVRLLDNSIVGAEALARWIMDGKVIAPANFIPILEKNGAICKLDFYILDYTCSCIREWLDKGYRVPTISVNFSRWNLQNANLANDILAVIDKNGIEPSMIEIEITETVNNEDYEKLFEVIRTLKKEGICTSIDDFGTGYSSLNMVRNVEIDCLKIDKKLIDNIGSDDKENRDRKLLNWVVRLADDMSIKSLAEGVETTAQRDYLKSIGCNEVQGYIYDRPLNFEDFEEKIKLNYIYSI